jgi:hypothetical protein
LNDKPGWSNFGLVAHFGRYNFPAE